MSACAGARASSFFSVMAATWRAMSEGLWLCVKRSLQSSHIRELTEAGMHPAQTSFLPPAALSQKEPSSCRDPHGSKRKTASLLKGEGRRVTSVKDSAFTYLESSQLTRFEPASVRGHAPMHLRSHWLVPVRRHCLCTEPLLWIRCLQDGGAGAGHQGCARGGRRPDAPRRRAGRHRQAPALAVEPRAQSS